MNQFKAAQDAHFDLIPEEKTTESLDLSTEHLNHFINYIHDLVELEVSQTEVYYEKLRQLGKLEGSISHDLHHMITSAYFTAVFETVAHDMDRERAIEYVNELAAFFNYGWNGLLRLI